MIRFELETAASICHGTLRAPDLGHAANEFAGMTQDTRQLHRQQLYCALAGENLDGHDLVAEAAARGAAAALVSRPVEATIATIEVDDVVVAMGRLAAAWRRDMHARLVGITGSNGKTTVKTMLAAITRLAGPVCATRGNYNNEIGVPLTLAALAPRHRFAVIEMGCGKPGDIAYLTEIAGPDVGLVTNAGPAHLERLGSVEGVARCKGELFASLPEDGIAVINRDDKFFDYWSGICRAGRRITFGLHRDADVRLESGPGGDRICHRLGSFALTLDLPGQHNRLNALAATAAALALEIDPEHICAGLGSVRALPGRLKRRQMRGDWTLIDDSYNANPESLRAALQVLAEHPGERWLVLGNMAELGPDSAKLHREIGQLARELGVDRLFVMGQCAEQVAGAFGPAAEVFQRHEDLAQRLIAGVRPGVACLVKGSRSAHMEAIVEQLELAEAATC